MVNVVSPLPRFILATVPADRVQGGLSLSIKIRKSWWVEPFCLVVGAWLILRLPLDIDWFEAVLRRGHKTIIA